MACWKCDGDHSPMDCRKWPGFAMPPDRTPPGQRMIGRRVVNKATVLKPKAEPAPMVPHSVLTKVKAAVEKIERKYVAPPGECEYCDRRRAQKAAAMRKRRGKQAGVPR